MAQSTPAGRKPTRPRTLSRAKIAGAALDLARESSATPISMRPIAARLGVDVAALYRHFENRADLLQEVSKLASESVELSAPPTGTWQERALELSRRVRVLLRDHPELSLHGGGSPGATPFNARAFGLIAGILVDAGVRDETLLHSAQAILDEITSIAQNDVLKQSTSPDAGRLYRRTMFAHLPDEVRDAIAGAKRPPGGPPDFDRYFDFAIRCLLEGIAQQAR